MKTRIVLFVVALLGCGWWGVSAARAGVMPVKSGDIIKLYDINDDVNFPQYLNGGPFRVDNFSDSKTDVLKTFCMERDESISYGTSYRVELSTVAQLGGVNTNAGDPLDPMTAYLFSNFHHGTNGGNLWSTKDLQEVFWYIEQELPGHTLSAGAQALYNLAQGKTSLYDVRIMNLYDANDNHRQSMLTVVPEPATVVLWGICGVFGLLVVRRRKRIA